MALERLSADVLTVFLQKGANAPFFCAFLPSILIQGYIQGYTLGLHFLRVQGYIQGYIFDFRGGRNGQEKALCTLVFGCFSGYNCRKLHRSCVFTPYIYNRKVLELQRFPCLLSCFCAVFCVYGAFLRCFVYMQVERVVIRVDIRSLSGLPGIGNAATCCTRCIFLLFSFELCNSFFQSSNLLCLLCNL